MGSRKAKTGAVPRRPPVRCGSRSRLSRQATTPSTATFNDDADVGVSKAPVHAQMDTPVAAPFVDHSIDEASSWLCVTCSRKGPELQGGDTKLARCSACGVPSYCSKTWHVSALTLALTPQPINRLEAATSARVPAYPRVQGDGRRSQLAHARAARRS